jgi:ADP-ribosylglycohydrolase
MAGAIVGARSGLAALPLRWVEGLHGRDLIDSAIEAWRERWTRILKDPLS